jgi:uncharacterized protein (DUF58 family)
MTRAPLRWEPSTQAALLALVGVAAAAAALALRDPLLLALATPSLWALVTQQRGPEPSSVDVTVPPELRLGEGERAELGVEVTVPSPVALLDARVGLPMEIEGTVSGSGDGQQIVAAGELLARRWGRRRVGPVRVRALGPLGLRRADVDIRVACDVVVLPRPVEVRASSAPALLPDRSGEHVSRASGPGVEPVGVRPFAWGDEARRIDWRATSRRGALHVTVAAAERSADLVVVVDALSDVGAAGATSLDRSVRAAAGLASRWLRDRDRVGLVVLGDGLTWLTPATGRVQQLRVAEAVLRAALPPGHVPLDLTRLPASVVPAGSVVVVLSPLLRPEVLDALVALRRRSHRLLVLDVLDVEPALPGDPLVDLALRFWRLDRAATLDRLRGTGTAVLRLDATADGELDRLVALGLRGVR